MILIDLIEYLLMSILQLYAQIQTPPNLQRHMQEVAVVCMIILDNWIGEKVDQQLTIQSALLHDLGNIVKFKRPFLGELEADIERWQAVQDEMILKYGSDAKKATHQMIAEIGLENSIGRVLHDMDRLLDGDIGVMPEAQIVEFADLCVSPEGIVGYNRRKQDLIHRYGAGHGLGWVEPADRLITAIQKNVAIDLNNIETFNFSEFSKRISQIILEDEVV